MKRELVEVEACENCGDLFDAPERTCPNPSPGKPYVHCGRGGHMFSQRIKVEQWTTEAS